MRNILVGVMFFLMAMGVAQSAPCVTTIADNYVGANGHGYGDIVGDSNFDVASMQVSASAGNLQVTISGNYFREFLTPNVDGTQLGDLFISTSGWAPVGPAPYVNDQLSNTGTQWDYAAVLSAHTNCQVAGDASGCGRFGGALALYALVGGNQDPRILTSFYPTPGWVAPGYLVRNGQAVQYDAQEAGANRVASATGSWTLDPTAGTLSLDIIDPGWTGTSELWGLHWTMSCGNDVIEGAAGYPMLAENENTPEPSTLILWGGLALMAGLARRRRGQQNV